MDHSEMLFAATVRDICGQLKNRDSGRLYKTEWMFLAPEERDPARAKWERENLSITYVPEALKLLDGFAEAIRSASAEQPQ
jgi:hypothetical protein